MINVVFGPAAKRMQDTVTAVEKRLKFAFILFKYFPFGGMQRDMLRTATHLAHSGHQVDIYTLSWEGALPDNINVHVIPAQGWANYKRYQSFIDTVFRQLREESTVDYIVGYNRMTGLDAHFAADPCFVDRAKAKPWITRLTPRYHWFAKMEQAVFAHDARCEILAVAKTEMAVFQRIYGTPAERMHYIPPYLSRERFAPQPREEMQQHLRGLFGIDPAHKVALLVGSGFSMKGLDRAISALAQLPERLRATTHLVAIGQDNPKPFLKMAKQLGIEDRVHISSGRQDIPWLMQGADVYIHPAYRENTGLVILEALASGLPALVTASCGYAHHVADAEAGMVVPLPFNQATLTDYLANMLETDATPWRTHGRAYAEQLMAENDGTAEADILNHLAREKTQEH